MSDSIACCLLVDVDGFLTLAAQAPVGWEDRTRTALRRLIDKQVSHIPDVRVEHLPPDEWLLTVTSTTNDEHLNDLAHQLAYSIHNAVRTTLDVTVTVAIGRVTTDQHGVSDAMSSARQAHRSKLALGPDRVICNPPDQDRNMGAARDIHRELARAISRRDDDGARRLLRNWYASAVEQSAGDDELVRRWLLGQVLATTATLDGRLGVGTASDWMAVCEAVPYSVLADLADLHEPAAVGVWLDRVVDALTEHHCRHLPRTSTLDLVRRHVDEHFTDPQLKLKAVARTVGVSPFHISHLFRSDLGTTFRDYVTQRRVRHARRLLEETRLGMAQVARASGFGTSVQLRRVLVRETGVTPSVIRHSARTRS